MAHSLFNPLLITGFAGSTFLSGTSIKNDPRVTQALDQAMKD